MSQKTQAPQTSKPNPSREGSSGEVSASGKSTTARVQSWPVDTLGPEPPNRVLANVWTQPLDAISVNPFVNHWKPTKLEMLRVWTIGLVMIVVRVVPFLVCVLTSCLLAKVFLAVIAALNRHSIRSDPFRQRARDICFGLLRIALFFSGFYWIRVIDKRRDRHRLAPIIPVAPHSSFFDLIVILKLKRPTFVSKSANQYMPLIGNVLRLCNGIYVNRENRDSRAQTKAEICKRANNGENVLIFPEGTCGNRTALVQFKMGAFNPKLPVQPILVRWDAGQTMDSVTWTWEGPGPGRIFLTALTRVSTNCEITILPEYVPSVDERANVRLFADNVSRVMCSELGVLQSFYSFDDVPLTPIARSIRLFRSPACMTLLKLCHKIHFKKVQLKLEKSQKKGLEVVSNEQPCPSPSTVNSGSNVGILGVGEDFEQQTATAEVYTPRNYYDHSKLGGALNKVLINTHHLLSYREDYPHPFKKNAAKKTGREQIEFEHLPISNARRRVCKFVSEMWTCSTDTDKDYTQLFAHFVQHCLTRVEQNFQYRLIESSDDLTELIGLRDYIASAEVLDQLRHSSIFVDILKIVEYSIGGPVTTIHLLAVLHLCDVREPDLWTRIETVVRLFDMTREATLALRRIAALDGSARPHTDDRRPPPVRTPVSTTNLMAPTPPWLTRAQMHTLLWYALGVQEFNDQFFLESQFDMDNLRENLTRVFFRATVENASQLFE